MQMIPIAEIHGNQFMKARVLLSPVVVVNGQTFRIPSSTRQERDHVVTFDSAEIPTSCSCTCEAGVNNTPCWAMARALDALTVLAVNNIYVRVDQLHVQVPPLRASIDGDGDLLLLTQQAGH